MKFFFTAFCYSFLIYLLASLVGSFLPGLTVFALPATIIFYFAYILNTNENNPNRIMTTKDKLIFFLGGVVGIFTYTAITLTLKYTDNSALLIIIFIGIAALILMYYGEKQMGLSKDSELPSGDNSINHEVPPSTSETTRHALNHDISFWRNKYVRIWSALSLSYFLCVIAYVFVFDPFGYRISKSEWRMLIKILITPPLLSLCIFCIFRFFVSEKETS